MSEIKKCIEYCLQNKKWTLYVIGATVIGLCIGAFFGVQAYYNGWLG